MRPFILTAIFPLVLAAQVAPTQPGWNFAHPDATLVGGLRPSALLNSPLFANAIEEATKKDPNAGLVIGMARTVLGGITEIRFSIQDTGKPQPDIIAVVSGQLDEALLAAMGQGAAPGSAMFRRVDPATLLLGNGPSLDAAAARMSSTAAMLRPRALLGADELASSDLWLSGQIPEGQLPVQVKDMLRGLALGLTLRDDITVALDVNTTTAALAAELVREAHIAENKQPENLRGMLKSFVDGTTARFRMTVPSQKVLDIVHSGQIPGLPGQTPTRLEPLTPLAPPVLRETAPQRRTVVIQGLEEGPRTIPLEQRR